MVVAPYPFERVPKVSRRAAALCSAIARWIGAHGGRGDHVAKLVGGAVRARVAGVAERGTVPRARDASLEASCELRVAGAILDARAPGTFVRRIAQRLLGGPEELAAPRPLGQVERAIWALVVAAALEDLGVAGQVMPQLEPVARAGDGYAVEIEVALATVAPVTIELGVPRDLELRVPPREVPPRWTERVTVPGEVVLGRCALPRAAIDTLAVRDLVTLEAPGSGLELVVLGGSLGLRAAAQAVVADVVTGYVRRDMAVPDEAHVELTVALGTTQLTLRQVCDLAIGQIVTLGRPLAGPFEVRAAGRTVGQGELVDVDGELAVRIVSLSNE